MKRGEVALSGVEGRNQWCVYILECNDKSLYTGIAKNLESRIRDHQSQRVHYTSYKLPVRLVYHERYPSQYSAANRERQLKGWTRKKKLALVSGNLQLLKKL